jgi:hypothetical protein
MHGGIFRWRDEKQGTAATATYHSSTVRRELLPCTRSTPTLDPNGMALTLAEGPTA